MSLIQTFEKFMSDEEAFDMFIVGPAGTGKTTSLKELLEYCLKKCRVITHECRSFHFAFGDDGELPRFAPHFRARFGLATH